MERNGSWNDVTVSLGEPCWVYVTNTTVTFATLPTGMVRWIVDAKREMLYLRCASNETGRVLAVGVGQDDNAAAVLERHGTVIPLGLVHGPFAVEVIGEGQNWLVYLFRTATMYRVARVSLSGTVEYLETHQVPATSQGFLEVRNGIVVTSDEGRFAHGLVLPNVTERVWAGQLSDPNGLGLYDETTGRLTVLFHGNTQPPHICSVGGAYYVCAWREINNRGVAWVEAFTRPFEGEEEPMNVPGVTITRFDPVLNDPAKPWKLEFHDRNNPGACSCVVEIVNGSVHASITNKAGSDRSVTRREVRCE